MKKNHLLSTLLFISLLLNTSLFPAAPMEERTGTMEIEQIAGKTNNITPTFVKKISTLASAKQWLQQKTNCALFDIEECSDRDRLAFNYALGFTLGAFVPTSLVAEAIASTGKVKSKKILALAQLIAEFAFLAIGLKGAALRPYTAKLGAVFTSAFLVIADIAGLVQQAQTTSSRLFFIKAIGNYIAMNTKCIWSESYCEQSLLTSKDGLVISPFTRRAILFFWIGFISGSIARKIPFSRRFNPVPQGII